MSILLNKIAQDDSTLYTSGSDVKRLGTFNTVNSETQSIDGNTSITCSTIIRICVCQMTSEVKITNHSIIKLISGNI